MSLRPRAPCSSLTLPDRRCPSQLPSLCHLARPAVAIGDQTGGRIVRLALCCVLCLGVGFRWRALDLTDLVRLTRQTVMDPAELGLSVHATADRMQPTRGAWDGAASGTREASRSFLLIDSVLAWHGVVW